MKWRIQHLPGFSIKRSERILTFDGWKTSYAWDPKDDERVYRFLEEATVEADDPEEAVHRFTDIGPACLRPADHDDPVSAMMRFMSTSQERDQFHSMIDSDTDVFLRMSSDERERRVTGGESPVDAGDFVAVHHRIGDLLRRALRGISRIIRG